VWERIGGAFGKWGWPWWREDVLRLVVVEGACGEHRYFGTMVVEEDGCGEDDAEVRCGGLCMMLMGLGGKGGANAVATGVMVCALSIRGHVYLHLA
jgi:hypothetical protein